MPIKPNSVYIKLLLFIALSSVAFAMWWFSLDSVRPFIQSENNDVFLQPQLISKQLNQLLKNQEPANKKQVTLVHFWNPDCLCNTLSQRHFDDLMAEYPKSELRVFVVTPSSINAEKEAEFNRLNGARMSLIKSDLPFPSSPALALIDSQLNIGYYGPYGFGAFCTPTNNSFFSELVKLYKEEASAFYMNVIGEGCYCDWPIQYKP